MDEAPTEVMTESREAAEAATEVMPAPEVAEPEPQEPEMAAEPEPPVDTQAVGEPAPPPADPSSTQVVPPEDVLGPGWAFTNKEGGDESGSEALHEEARRLARLLVTEIKLYNEEQVEEGRRNRDVYQRLREDIDRSRLIYQERVAPEVLEATDYYHQELVRVLAGGDPDALGM